MPKKRSFAFRSFRTQRVAFFLFLVLIGFQIYLENTAPEEAIDILVFDAALQEQIDSAKLQKQQPRIFPFNPNYISLSKGYQLGLSLEEIKRLHRYRDTGKFINSVTAFEQITQVTPSWLKQYSPYFKFPDWVTAEVEKRKKPKAVEVKDLNTSTAADLTQVRGIGAVLSERIIKYRTRLQGFDELNQLFEVYGLDSLVVENVKRQFKIKTKPKRTKIPLAVVSLEALLRIPYLSKSEAKKIIGLRTRNQNLTLKNLRSEPGFDSLKIERLALYLH
ncbi:MAG: helix-hairpin-helix domain-containing protein [Flavobacteriaceae bacterium]|nr:helix-hairpin-helix domain-containing protein [Flavobacteriaceae bacterium]MDG1090878.1 helix-hairpin-helix domain-containing protein [Flavobacteriaceae bacterium]